MQLLQASRTNLRAIPCFGARKPITRGALRRCTQGRTVRVAASSSWKHTDAACWLAAPALLASLAAADPALALEIHMEPANALSIPTWAVHVSSVVEWALAIGLMWQYAEVSGNERWKGMSWGMLPCLGSAMAACTWHFFYNSPDLEFLVAFQAFLTVVGNCTCWLAAYRIYQAAKEETA